MNDYDIYNEIESKVFEFQESIKGTQHASYFN